MKSATSLLIKTVTLSLVLGVALGSFGCTQSTDSAGGKTAKAPVDMNAKVPELPKDVPPETAKSIEASQASGRAMAAKAQADGSASGKASSGWR